MEDAVAIIDRLATAGINASDESAGVGAGEALRGILFHEYHYNEVEMCTWANQVIPTIQNLATRGADMRMAAAQVVDREEDFIQARDMG